MSYQSAAASHPGLARGNNEDRVYTDAARGFFLVVDGMGGHAAGEHAAEIAVERIRARLERQTDSVEQRLREAITLANNAIFQAAQVRPDWAGMACVLTVTVIQDGKATAGHVGDSRLYKIRAGRIEKITRDHSPVGEREDRGEISEADAMRNPRRNEVFRDVGSEERTPEAPDFIDIVSCAFEPDAALLLCTDGLSDVVPSAEILRIVERHAGDCPAAVAALIEAANRDSKDNVSAVLIEGPQFAAAPAAGVRPANRHSLLRDLAFLAGGIALGLVPLAISIMRREPPPRAPQLIRVAAPGSLAAALDQAMAGDTIEAGPGEYAEELRLKEGVTLIAAKPRETVVAPRQGIGVLAESVRRARVIGIRVAGSPETGILVRNSNVDLERVEVTGARAAGVQYSGAAQGILQASYIHHNAGAGIVIHHPAAPAIENNVIVENGKGKPPLPGVEILTLNRPALVGNTIANNGAEPVWQTGPPDAALIERNFFSIDPRMPPRRKVRLLRPQEAPR